MLLSLQLLRLFSSPSLSFGLVYDNESDVKDDKGITNETDIENTVKCCSLSRPADHSVGRTLVAQTLRVSHRDIFPISLRTFLPQSPTISDPDEYARVPHKANHRNNDIGIAVSHRRDPRRDAVINRKAHSVPSQHARGDHVATELRVRGDGVPEGGRHCQDVVDGEEELRDDEPDPVDVVCHAQAIEQHAERHQEHGR